MKIKDSMKLKVFESALDKTDKHDLVCMIESASTIDELDYIEELFSEKVSVSYDDAYALKANEKLIEGLKKSEYADEFSSVIDILEKYNNEMEDYLEKHGSQGDKDTAQYLEHKGMNYINQISKEMSKKSLKLQVEFAKLGMGSQNVDPDEVKRRKEELEAAKSFEKQAIKIVKSMERNAIAAAKKIKTETKEKIDELKDKLKSTNK